MGKQNIEKEIFATGTWRILLVELAPHFRKTMEEKIGKRLPKAKIRSAASPKDAMALTETFRPMAIVLNFALAAQKQDDSTFLVELTKKQDIPVIVYGSLSSSRMLALSMGAYAFLVKPRDLRERELFYDEIIMNLQDALHKASESERDLYQEQNDHILRELWDDAHFGIFRSAALTEDHPARTRADAGPPDRSARVFNALPPVPHPQDASRPPAKAEPISLIAIGSSTGGTTALRAIIPKLRPPMPPILVVQHILSAFSRQFAMRLNAESVLHVKEAESGDRLEPNRVYIAPGHKHMTLRRDGGELVLDCRPGRPVNSVCPSADVLFHSVAQISGVSALGIILTGMGKDGADGLLEMLHRGARTLGEDEASCVVYGMPKAAYDIGAVERQVPLEKMAEEIGKICGQGRAGEDRHLDDRANG